MNDKDCQEIQAALIRVMCKADEEFQEQLATGIGVSLQTFQEYLDKVDVWSVKAIKE